LARFALCALPDVGEGNAKPPVPLPGDGDLAETVAAVAPMTGAEYLTAATLAELWRATDAAFDAELADAALSVQGAPSTLGIDALLDFTMEVTLDGERLSAAEIKRLLTHSDGLALIRGKWVEVDRARLSRTLEQFEAIERRASTDGLSFGEAMRMLAGAGIAANDMAVSDVAWSETVAGPWLAGTLAALRSPDGRLRVGPGSSLHGTLRPYQLAGMQWLYLLARLGLGEFRASSKA
jgi:hypothetical protein